MNPSCVACLVAKDQTASDSAHQHIFTLAADPKAGSKLFGFDTFEIHSIDGGAAQTQSDMKAGKHAGDSNCRSIQLLTKQVVLHKTQMVHICHDDGRRALTIE